MREIKSNIVKVFAALFLVGCFYGGKSDAATYNCIAQTVKDAEKVKYDAAGNKNLTFAAFKKSVHDNRKYLFLGARKNSTSALVCGHEGTDGCKTGSTQVWVLGKHGIADVGDFSDNNYVGVYRCAVDSHKWSVIPKTGLASNCTGAQLLAKENGTNKCYYCKDTIRQSGDTKYCTGICYSDCPVEQKKESKKEPVPKNNEQKTVVEPAPGTEEKKNPDQTVQSCRGNLLWDPDSQKCLTPCNYYRKHPNETSRDRLACCKLDASVAVWKGSATSGVCECVDKNKQFENNQCVDKVKDVPRQKSVEESPVVEPLQPNNVEKTDEQKCADLGDAVAKWENGACVCLAEGMEYVGDKCVKNGLVPAVPARAELTGRKDGEESEINGGGVSEKQTITPVVTGNQQSGVVERTPQDICKDLDANVAFWNGENCECIGEFNQFIYDAETQTGRCEEDVEKAKQQTLAEKQTAYDNAKATQQSTANKLLGGLTTAATGLGTMEALRGFSEQQADKKADADMDAYIATMRCSYADGKSVKAGLEPIELPGGNDENLMKYRNEYIALATSLKNRKESLGMKPGIESELILDKADIGLYDQENVGITGGSYSSLYRAKMQNSETDQTQIAEESQKSANRLKYGAIAAGAGVAVGVIGNSLINGKLGELIRGKAKKENVNTKKVISVLDNDKEVQVLSDSQLEELLKKHNLK